MASMRIFSLWATMMRVSFSLRSARAAANFASTPFNSDWAVLIAWVADVQAALAALTSLTRSSMRSGVTALLSARLLKRFNSAERKS